MTEVKVAGLTFEQIVDINQARETANLSVKDLVEAIISEDYLIAKQKSRIIFLEAKLKKLTEIINDKQED